MRAMSRLILKSGADGLTAHPRPDERHIRKSDVPDLKKIVQSYKGRELNIEGFPSKNFLDLVAEVRPDQCSLVPDPPYVLTSNAGWRLHKNLRLLEGALKRLRERKHPRQPVFRASKHEPRGMGGAFPPFAPTALSFTPKP